VITGNGHPDAGQAAGVIGVEPAGMQHVVDRRAQRCEDPVGRGVAHRNAL
jgi:hypothetical protein